MSPPSHLHEADPGKGAASPGTRSPTILLVEDNEPIRSAFTILLQEFGYRTLSAGTGGEALELAEREPPTVVILDLGLPDMSGLDVARQLKGQPQTRGSIILALTGRALDTDRESSHQAGCSGYLVKPISAQRLLEEVGNYIPAQRPLPWQSPA